MKQEDSGDKDGDGDAQVGTSVVSIVSKRKELKSGAA